MENEIKVSVMCMVYNHAKYLRQCLDSFIMQKTNFAFEVIVHDDASTDGSADIIREYAEKYPDIIVPILQTENQCSKHVFFQTDIMLPMARGQYLADCEGDDYWVDPYKLQKQADALDANPNCSMCVHKVERVNLDGEILGRPIPQTPCATGIVTSEEVIKRICKEYAFHTSSMFRRREIEVEYGNPMPEFRRVSRVGDEPRLMFFATKGDFYYFDEAMSHYRKGVKGSYTTAFSANEKEKKEKAFTAAIAMLKAFDQFSDYKYHTYLDKRIRNEEIYLLSLREEYRKILSKEYRAAFKRKSFNAKLYIVLGAIHPALPKVLRRFKKSAGIGNQ